MTCDIYKQLGSEVVLSPVGNFHFPLFSASSGAFTTGEFPFPLLHAIECNWSIGAVQQSKMVSGG